MTARDDEGAAVIAGEGRKHPDGRQVHDRVRVRRGHITGVPLVEGPVRVPSTAVVPRLVDGGRGEGDAEMVSEQRLDQAEEPPVREPGRQRLVVFQETAYVADIFGCVGIPVAVRRSDDPAAYLVKPVPGNDVVQHAPAIELHGLNLLFQRHVLLARMLFVMVRRTWILLIRIQLTGDWRSIV